MNHHRIKKLKNALSELRASLELYDKDKPISALIRISIANIEACVFLDIHNPLPDETLGGKECQ